MRVEVQFGKIEEPIREHLGQTIVEIASQRQGHSGDVDMSGSHPLYTGPLSLKEYRQYFPCSDNYETLYLKLTQVDPKLAEIVANYYKTESDRLDALIRKGNKGAKKLVRRRTALGTMICFYLLETASNNILNRNESEKDSRNEFQFGEIEELIRAELGEEVVKKSLQKPGYSCDFEMRDGHPFYTGDLSLSKYREFFQFSDNYATIYLSLAEINPLVAEIVATYYQIEKNRLDALERNDDKLIADLIERRNDFFRMASSFLTKTAKRKNVLMQSK